MMILRAGTHQTAEDGTKVKREAPKPLYRPKTPSFLKMCCSTLKPLR